MLGVISVENVDIALIESVSKQSRNFEFLRTQWTDFVQPYGSANVFFFCALSSNLPGTDYSFKCSKLKDLYASIAIHKVIYALPPAISKGTVTSDRLIADPF